MLSSVLQCKFTYWILFLYIIVVGWWIRLQIGELGMPEAYIFDWFYGLIGLSGAGYGIYTAVSKWGGWDSVIGRGLILLPLGLLGQWLGLQVWTYFNIVVKVEVPYPSFADVGYFALIPAYTLGALMFAQASGAKFSLKTNGGRIWAFLIPLAAIFLSSALFLKNIGFDLSNPIKLFFDIGYPIGEIIPVSIALFTLALTRNLLGGTMRDRILFLVAAFSFQFLTEYAFLYTAGAQTYVNGGWNDLMYATSYMIMSLGLISFSNYE